MDNKTWREKIYGPYNDAWKIIKLLQYCTAHEGNWDVYVKEFDRFCKQYADETAFGDHLAKFIMTAAEDIRDINEGELCNTEDQEKRVHIG